MDPYARHLARCFGPAGGLRAVRATPAMRKTSVMNSVKNGITRPRRVGKRMLPHWEHHGPLGLCAETRSVGYVSMSCEAQLNYTTTQDSGRKTGGRGSATSRRASPFQRMLEAITSNLGLQSSADTSRVWERRARGARCAKRTCRGARAALRLHTLHLHRACSWRGGVR